MASQTWTISSPQPVGIYPAGMQPALLLSNTSTTAPVWVNSVPDNNGWQLAPGCSLAWEEAKPLYAYVSGGTSVQLVALTNAGDLTSPPIIAPGSITAAAIAAGTITADKLAVGVLEAQTIAAGSITTDMLAAGAVTADKVSAGVIDGTTINGVNITGAKFSTTGGTSRVDIGQVGYPTDQIRLWNSGYVVSLRNPDDNPGNLRVSLWDGGIIDVLRTSEGHRGILMGATLLKWLTGTVQMQVRNAADTTYGSIVASAFTVSTSLTKFKRAISAVPVDTAAEIAKNGLNQWEWIDPESGLGKQYGLLADDMPPWMREGNGYSLNAAVAFLWEALKQSNARIAALEGKTP